MGDVDPVFFAGRSLYLLPDGAAAQHPYGVLVDALAGAAKVALGRVVLSGSRHLVLVRPCGKLLALDVLHYPARVRSAASWEADLMSSTATLAEREQPRDVSETGINGARDGGCFRERSRRAATSEAFLCAPAPGGHRPFARDLCWREGNSENAYSAEGVLSVGGPEKCWAIPCASKELPLLACSRNCSISFARFASAE
jgi:hypothetical protein